MIKNRNNIIDIDLVFFRCKLPFELENASYSINESVWKQFYPWDSLRQSYSSCEILVKNKSESCDNFIFDHEVYGYTSVIEVSKKNIINDTDKH